MNRAERRRQERSSPTEVSHDRVVLVLAVVGLLLAAYLTWLKLTGARAALCPTGSGCDLVQASRYATLLGVPTAAWGAAFYAAVGGLALAGLGAGRRHLAFLLACAGAGVSLYLTYVSVAIIHASCAYCLASTALAVALPVVIAVRAPVPRLTPPSSMAMQGTVVGLLAIAAVAGAFALTGGGAVAPASDYETALARHLKTSGAVFYGAFW